MSDAVDELRTAIVPVNSEEPVNGQALTARERASVLVLINSDGHADLSIGEIWAPDHPPGQGQARTPGRRPVAGVDVVNGQAPRTTKGIFSHLYVLIDICCQYNPSRLISPCEDSRQAADFIAEAIPAVTSGARRICISRHRRTATNR